MKRTRSNENESFTKLKFDIISISIIKQLINNEYIIDFYKQTEKSFTNDSLSQFLKDYKRLLNNQYEDHDFKFIKCTKIKEQLDISFKKIQDYSHNNNLNIDVWSVFIDLKIKPYLSNPNYKNILNNIKTLNLIELYNIFKIIYSKNNLVLFANIMYNKKGKVKDKQHAIKLINNNRWNDYIDYHKIDINYSYKIKLNKLCKSYNKQLMRKLFVYYKTYKNDTREMYLRRYMNRWIQHFRRHRIELINKIDVGNDPNEGLANYLRLIDIK